MTYQSNNHAAHVRHGAWRMSFICIAAVFGGCAGTMFSSPEVQVQQRAADRLRTQVAGDFDKMYGFYAPGFREVVSQEAFNARFGNAVKWVDAEVIEVTCSESVKCSARVRVDYKPRVKGATNAQLSTYFNETWQLDAGQWWLYEPLGKKATETK